ncbi:hypothetical protein [Olivibacter sp. XZL3]|uniref:hypothetical protein n=1 Tax=Olivibacter sp. XZL3 TaxID=1735116 RepID=UPI0014170FF8|nr:hypothetical protein [Olivibacter sp. XZL3]
MIKKTAIIVLAAGNSSRLGTPKQLLGFEDKSLQANCPIVIPEDDEAVLSGADIEAYLL